MPADKLALFIGLITFLGGLMLYKLWPRGITRIKIIEIASLLQLLSEIRSVFTLRYRPVLKLNRAKRRSFSRGGEEYSRSVDQLKEQASLILQESILEVLARYKLSESLFAYSIQYHRKDREVHEALIKITAVVDSRASPNLTLKALRSILELYIDRLSSLSDKNPNLAMKILEDEILEKFGFETEEIEASTLLYRDELEDLVEQVRFLNDNFRQLIF